MVRCTFVEIYQQRNILPIAVLSYSRSSFILIAQVCSMLCNMAWLGRLTDPHAWLVYSNASLPSLSPAHVISRTPNLWSSWVGFVVLKLCLQACYE